MNALISEPYRALQEELHARDDRYGVASLKYAARVAAAMDALRETEVLDYGAGKGRLGQALAKIAPHIKVHAYDPAVLSIARAPEPCGFVACIDVLEHVEPALLHNVLDDLQRVTLKHGFFTVSTRAAAKTLADGRNAHLIQQPVEWWLPLLDARFRLACVTPEPAGLACTVRALASRDAL